MSSASFTTGSLPEEYQLRLNSTADRPSDTFRSGLIGFICLILAMQSACSDMQPFEKRLSLSQKPATSVALSSIEGMPASKSAVFQEALSASARRRGYVLTDNEIGTSSLKLDGGFLTRPAAGGVRLFYHWALRDRGGRVVGTIAGDEFVPVVGAGDTWASIKSERLQNIAAYTAENMSSQLAQLGYGTQSGGLPPPIESFIQAQPGAERDLDYETLQGPGRTETTALMADHLIPAADVPEVAEGKARVLGSTETSKFAQDHQSNPIKTYKIEAVAVIPVSGSQPERNAELTEAMRRTLKLAGWTVLTAPRDDALTIRGTVKLGEVVGDNQNVSLAWTVIAPNRKILGTITQSNNIKAGSIESGWGETAIVVVEAAATGIFDLVKSLKHRAA